MTIPLKLQFFRMNASGPRQSAGRGNIPQIAGDEPVAVIEARVCAFACKAVLVLRAAGSEWQRFVGAVSLIDVVRPGVAGKEREAAREAPLASDLHRLVVGLAIARQITDRAPARIGTVRLKRHRARRRIVQVAAVVQMRCLAADIGNFEHGRFRKLPLHGSAPLHVIRVDAVGRNVDDVDRRDRRDARATGTDSQT